MTLCALSVQLLSEKISGAEGTKLEEDFLEMERVSPAHAEGCGRPAHRFHSYARDRTGRSDETLHSGRPLYLTRR